MAKTLSITLSCGKRMAYQKWGDTSSTKGRILCTHGWLDNSNSFSYLGPILAAKGYEIIAIDWLGHGHSDHIEGLLNQLSITSINIYQLLY